MNKSLKRFILISLFTFLTISSGYSAEIVFPNSLVLRELLVSRQFAKLNQTLTEYQTQFETDITQEVALDRAYSALSLPDPKHEEIMNQWVEKYPGSYIPYLARGFYYKDMGWFSRGTRFSHLTSDEQFSALARFHDKAVKDISRSIDINPKITIAYSALIDISKGRSFHHLAGKALSDGLKLNPASYEIRKSYLFSITPRWGGSFEKIAEFLTETKPHAATNPSLIPLGGFADYIRGLRARESDEFEKGKILLTKALEHGEKSWYYQERGMCHYWQKEYQKALGDFDRAIELFPEYVEALQWRSWAYRKLDMPEKALEDLNFAIDLDPFNSVSLKYRGRLFSKLEQYGDAIDDFRTALEYDPKNAKIWYSLGWYQNYRLKNSAEAVEALMQATELDRNNAKYWYHYVVALNNLRDCKMVSATKQYLWLCGDSTKVACKAKRKEWANNRLDMLVTSNICPNVALSTSAPEPEPEPASKSEMIIKKAIEYVEELYKSSESP